MTDQTTPKALRGRSRLAFAAAGLLVIGGAAGAVTVAATRPSVSMAPANPVAIRSLADTGIVTIRGRVAEIYGNKFVMQDPSGRALVDLGREGENGTLVSGGQTVTVQGRFEQGFVDAAFLVGANGKVAALGPVGGPREHGRDGRDGPHGRHRPDRDGPDGEAGPPPAVGAPAPAAPAAAPSPAA